MIALRLLRSLSNLPSDSESEDGNADSGSGDHQLLSGPGSGVTASRPLNEHTSIDSRAEQQPSSSSSSHRTDRLAPVLLRTRAERAARRDQLREAAEASVNDPEISDHSGNVEVPDGIGEDTQSGEVQEDQACNVNIQSGEVQADQACNGVVRCSNLEPRS
jgi:hypothetical protein